jgi:hypothetical protein
MYSKISSKLKNPITGYCGLLKIKPARSTCLNEAAPPKIQHRHYYRAWNCVTYPLGAVRIDSSVTYKSPTSFSIFHRAALTSFSSMTLQSNADLRLLKGLLPVGCVFYLSFQFLILHLLIYVSTQCLLFFGRPLTRLS